jgi:uncharacterized protein (TIGR02596 family)
MHCTVETHHTASKAKLFPMRNILPNRQGRRGGFSLIELLVVVTIIVLVMAMATPALTRTLQAGKLSSAGDSLLGIISQAQQYSNTYNLPVEIRFFKFNTDLDLPGARQDFRAYMMFKVTTGALTQGSTLTETFVPMGGITRLPESITLVADPDLSPLLPSANSVADTKNGSSPGYSGVSGATYNAIRFMPDGTFRLPGAASASTSGLTTIVFAQDITNSHITLASDAGAASTKSTLPKNFYTIQIDPFSGKARTYRPGF